MLEWITVMCPYCGESQETSVDCSAGSQCYVEDCQICCQPMVFNVQVETDGSLGAVDVRQEND
jgi:hypothetical protein